MVRAWRQRTLKARPADPEPSAPARRGPALRAPSSWRSGWAPARRTAAALVACGLGGCVAAPNLAPRADEAVRAADAVSTASSSAAVRQVARQVDVHNGRSRLGPAQREALLKRLAAQGQSDALHRHLAALAELQEDDLIAGNRSELLVDGPATFDSVFKAIEGARRSVMVESYIVEDATVATRMAELLARKRRQGVEVAMIYDAVGSIGTDAAYFEALKAAGVGVCAFNPILSAPARKGQSPTERDHRKIIAVDAKVAFTGGINISDVYASGSFGGSRRSAPARPDGKARDDGWRDTQVRVQGPAAAGFDHLVRATWRDQGCKGALGDTPPPPPPSGPDVVHIVASSPSDAYSRMYSLLMTAFDTAQQSIHVTMAYFAPGSDMIDALADAARRGVDVKLVLPSRSDFAPVLHAGRAHYQTLLEAGVRLYEFQGAVLHAKTASVDGVWSTVGSTNMDYRSFVANNEINLLVLGEDFGAHMARMFERDLAASREVTLEQWRQRPLAQRLKEFASALFERWW